MKSLTRFLSAAVLLIAALTTLTLATEIPPGPVTGNWYATGNPYNINGEINVPTNNSLSIHPGVQVIFQGHYKFIVNAGATLQAVGTMMDTVLFTAIDTTVGWGGIRFLQASGVSRLEYCHITLGRAEGDSLTDKGGGVFCYYTDATISHCLIDHCWSFWDGGAISCRYCSPVITNNTLRENTNDMYGGAICIWASNAIITNNTIAWNSCYHSGGGLNISNYCQPLIENNLILGNSAIYYGGGIRGNSQSAPPTLRNNTIVDNSANEGGSVRLWSSYVIENCIIWANSSSPVFGGSQVTYSCVQGGYSGTGNINQNPLFVNGPEGNYYLSQIAAGQEQESPCVDAGNPTSPLIEGTTRTDEVQDYSIVDMGYHYPSILPPPTAFVELTPFGIPIQIPIGGGAFDYNIAATNTQTSQVTCTVWCNATLPNGNIYGPVMGPTTITLPGGASLNRNRTQEVPSIAPPGNYIYHAYIGTYPDSAWDTDAFTFTKLRNGDGSSGAGEWLCTGSPFPGEENGGGRTPALQPEEFKVDVTPNPFNPSTDIRYQMPDARYVSLRVYDTAGRLVETLVDGWREAGEHRATFDGSGLPSGVYLYRLVASGSGTTPTTECGKMVLLK